MRKTPWQGTAESYLKTCLDHMRTGVKTGYAPNIHEEIEYLLLSKRDKELVDNIYKSTFKIDGIY